MLFSEGLLLNGRRGESKGEDPRDIWRSMITDFGRGGKEASWACGRESWTDDRDNIDLGPKGSDGLGGSVGRTGLEIDAFNPGATRARSAMSGWSLLNSRRWFTVVTTSCVSSGLSLIRRRRIFL